ncbi:unnamed protein product [Prorocentrum cordatum]|uniref:BART domain-containing protein n=1 Tax=Prorocentrum cordatum TaxID=2364126 RepID=A0ABN9VJ84_9DINO|nr:unnamed protein product [Polarella glacialis]
MAEDTEHMEMPQVFNFVLESFQDPKFTAEVETLICTNIDLFAKATADGSHPLEWEMQHRKYKKLHEDQLQRSVSLCNASFEEFMEYVAVCNQHYGDDPGFQSLMTALTNSEDYTAFCQVMFNAVRENWVPEDSAPPPLEQNIQVHGVDVMIRQGFGPGMVMTVEYLGMVHQVAVPDGFFQGMVMHVQLQVPALADGWYPQCEVP